MAKKVIIVLDPFSGHQYERSDNHGKRLYELFWDLHLTMMDLRSYVAEA